MLVVLPFRIIGVIQHKNYVYILDYNENITAQYMYKQAVIHSTLSNRLYQIQYITPQATARQYRSCIMDSDMASYIMVLSHVVFNAIPPSPF